MTPATLPRILVVMGVSGSGKSTVAEILANRLGWPFQEGDDLHPRGNRDKMASGVPLDDADRAPWLAAVAAWIDARLAAGEHGIVTCSALKRAYRAVVIGQRPGVMLVYLHAERAVLLAHIAARHHAFMPASLLDSQLATLEEPDEREAMLKVEVAGTPAQTAASVIGKLEVSARTHD